MYALASLGRTFDVVLCLGVYYHLVDPFHAFAQIRHCCHPGTVVILEGDVVCGHGLAESGEPGIFIPSASALRTMLRAAYLDVRSQRFLRTGRARAILDRLPGRLVFPRPVDRALTVCEPFCGRNELHAYEPPFGLAAYDENCG